MLYYSIVYPHILQGIIFGGSTYTSHLKKLQLLQNKAVRAICSLNWRKHVTSCFDRLSILKVRDVAKMEMAKFVHKSVNHSLPKYFQTYFHKVSLAHKRSARSSSSDNLAIPLFRTSRMQRSIKYRVTQKKTGPNSNYSKYTGPVFFGSPCIRGRRFGI